MVVFTTTHGEITIELFENDAPVTCDNFLQYVDSEFFDDTIFHRVIPNFMIQCGGFTEDMTQKETRSKIKNEAANGRLNERGTLAMARTQAVDSATSQFFVNLKDNSFLDHTERDFGYAVFGRVVDGMDVADKIAGVETGTTGTHQNVPKQPVKIISIRKQQLPLR